MSRKRPRHRQHGNPFNVHGDIERPDWPAIFGRSAPLALDIGFGAGQFAVALARRHPEWDVVGIEIRQHFVDQLLEAAQRESLRNVHAALANANTHLDPLIPDDSTVFVAINFPDPWFKNRHHKRRVVRPEWIATLSKKLRPGAELHMMSDYEPVAKQIESVLERAPDFSNVHGAGVFLSESTTGLPSEREVTHMKRGEPVYRLQFRYQRLKHAGFSLF